MKPIVRSTLSTFLVAIFAIIIVILALFAEVFESHDPEVDLAQIYANPVPIVEIQYLKSLRITNKQGDFLLENTDPQGRLKGPWQLIEPQSLKVKDDVVIRIIDALNVIRVRNFHRYEPINLSSYSLDNPTLVMRFTTSRDKVYELKMGLINPIDNSAYLTLSSQNQIYQIDPIEMALESYDLVQLVESKVLAINPATLVSLEINKPSGLQLRLLKKNESWVDQNAEVLAPAKVQQFINKIEDIKSTSILSALTTEQRQHLEKLISAPAISLKLTTSQGMRIYLLSELKESIPGMPIEKDRYYILSSEDRKSFVIIEKDQVKVFSTMPSMLK